MKTDLERVYHENGSLKYKLPYVNGAPHGISYYFYETGELETILEYV
jgi:antitoxin component YwqK of YwqJK toxin-antitoxin module